MEAISGNKLYQALARENTEKYRIFPALSY